jgi:hypothetical protein
MPRDEVGPRDTIPEGTDTTTSADQSTDTHIISDRPQRHITVTGPGRCEGCSFHVATQGHRAGCDGTAPIEPPSIWTDNFLENMRRLKALETGIGCAAKNT